MVSSGEFWGWVEKLTFYTNWIHHEFEIFSPRLEVEGLEGVSILLVPFKRLTSSEM